MCIAARLAVIQGNLGWSVGREIHIKRKNYYDRQATVIDGAKAQLDDLSGQIDKLEASANAASGSVKVAYDKQIANLKAQQKEAEAHLEKVAAAGASDWEAAKSSATSAWDSLKSSIAKATAAIK